MRRGEDRGESIGLMEPMRLSEGSPHRPALADLAVEITAQSSSLAASLPPHIGRSLATLVRAMNCYYSNLIEGHNTHPIDIERALRNDFSQDAAKRDLQLEAKAHISVQTWIDDGGLDGRATSIEGVREMHRRFCAELPEELLKVEDKATGLSAPLIGGAPRQRDVQVGRHVAPSPGAVPRFLARFEQAYGRLGRSEAILAAAAAHHRLLWIHPFLDGNGRVARLMSHAMLREALGSGSLWSIARGLARNEARYKQHLAACDQGRRNDLDGRGTLSEEELASFTRFMLEVALDQVVFMRGLMQPERLRGRIELWVAEEARAGRLPPKAGVLLDGLLYRGALPRAEIPALLGVGDRQARRVTRELLAAGVLVSEGPRSPIALGFPAALAGRWMPGLFPDRPEN